MPDRADLVAIDLTEEERYVLNRGLVGWRGLNVAQDFQRAGIRLDVDDRERPAAQPQQQIRKATPKRPPGFAGLS